MSERSVSKRKQEKRWYTVLAPEQFDRVELGTTPADDPEQLYDRTIETTLGELNNDASENNTKLTFRIVDVGSDSAYTEFVRHELTRDYQRSSAVAPRRSPPTSRSGRPMTTASSSSPSRSRPRRPTTHRSAPSAGS